MSERSVLGIQHATSINHGTKIPHLTVFLPCSVSAVQKLKVSLMKTVITSYNFAISCEIPAHSPRSSLAHFDGGGLRDTTSCFVSLSFPDFFGQMGPQGSPQGTCIESDDVWSDVIALCCHAESTSFPGSSLFLPRERLASHKLNESHRKFDDYLILVP